MIATCYTIRPVPDSGWVTFFELGRGGLPHGLFLILGPATVGGARPDPEWRHEAHALARQIVTAWKARLDSDPGEWLRTVARQGSTTSRVLELGALILRGDEAHSLCTGRVRLFPLTATARMRRGAEGAVPGRPERTRVEAGDRYFFGRIPEELLRAGSSTADLEGVERAGGRDGALILTFLPGEARATATGDVEPVAREADLSPSRRLRRGATPRGGAGEQLPLEAPIILPFEPPAPRSADPAPPAPGPDLPPPRPVEPAPVAPMPIDRPPGKRPTPTLAEPPVTPSVPLVVVPPPDPAVPEHPSRPGAVGPWLLAVGALLLLAGWLVVGRPLLGRHEAGLPETTSLDATTTTATPPDAPAAADIGIVAPTAPGGTAWEVQFAGAVTGTPLVLSDRVIVATRSGEIVAVDREGGGILWRQSARKGFGGGVVGHDSLVTVAGFDGILRGFDARDGRELFQVETAGRIASPPVRTSEGFHVVASYDRTLYAYDPEEAKTVWKTRLGAILWASPAAGSRYLYQPGLDGVVAAVNSRWGSVLWRFKAGGEIYSTPAATAAAVVFGCEDGSIYGVTPEEGRLLWRTPAGAAVSGGVRAEGSLILVGDDAGTLHALDAATGRVSWRYEAGTPIKSTPTVDDGVVVVSTLGGTLHAVTLDGGESIGRYPIGAPMASSPVISGDSLFVGTHDGRLVALRLR